MMRTLVFALCFLWPVFVGGQSWRVGPIPQIRKAWDDAELETYELPLSYGKRAQYMKVSEYYAIPPRQIYRSYPVYRLDREPKDYLAWLKTREPQIAFDSAKLKTERDWIEAGSVVFDSPNIVLDLDEIPLRDPGLYTETRTPVTKDGIVPGISYVIRKRGTVEIGFDSCAMCHTRLMEGGGIIRGAQGNLPWHRVERYRYQKILKRDASVRKEVQSAYWSEYGAPWAPQPELRSIDADILMDRVGSIPPGVFIRHGTRPAYPAKIPDLIGVKERLYLDSTGLGQHRSIKDLMRYAITNQTTDRIASFDGFRPWDQSVWLKQTNGRYSDEQLYALALYIYSLKPPPNPNRFDSLAARGQKVFNAQGCATCHTPPLYTNNKLTPVQGFSVPEAHNKQFDIMPIVVGTDPSSALTTRRGTGYYKIPSLKGVWYRGPLEHNGSVATLEDWFDPGRLKGDYVPTGFKGLGLKTRAVKGHEFGLYLSSDDKRALVAFLRTL